MEKRHPTNPHQHQGRHGHGGTYGGPGSSPLVVEMSPLGRKWVPWVPCLQVGEFYDREVEDMLIGFP